MTETNNTNEKKQIKLISSEGKEFLIDEEAAMFSGTIKSMLSGPGTFAEQTLGEVTFREIPSNVLEKVIAYMAYKQKYLEITAKNPQAEVPEFPIEPEIALELLMAANFLDI